MQDVGRIISDIKQFTEPRCRCGSCVLEWPAVPKQEVCNQDDLLSVCKAVDLMCESTGWTRETALTFLLIARTSVCVEYPVDIRIRKHMRRFQVSSPIPSRERCHTPAMRISSPRGMDVDHIGFIPRSPRSPFVSTARAYSPGPSEMTDIQVAVYSEVGAFELCTGKLCDRSLIVLRLDTEKVVFRLDSKIAFRLLKELCIDNNQAAYAIASLVHVGYTRRAISVGA